MAKRLTAAAVEKAKAGDRRHEIPDALVPGLYLIVQPSGARSWAVRYRHGLNDKGKPATRKLTLPGFPTIDVARKLARAALDTVAQGGDPAAEKQAAKSGPDRDLVRMVVDEFLIRHVAKNRTAAEVKQTLEREVLPLWGDRRLQDVTRRDVLDLLDGLVDRGAPVAANRLLAVVRKLFAWAVERDKLAGSPCAGVKRPTPEVSRDRVLSDDEIRLVWKAADALGYPFGPMTKLLLLTGQRLSEVADMSAGEIVGDTWGIPAARSKNKRAHAVPLSAEALAVIAAMPRVVGRNGYLFTTTGTTPVSGFSRAKDKLDKLILTTLREADPGAELAEWRLHDLRRTAATKMADELAIAPHVVEAALNHLSGSKGGIAGVYNRARHDGEKRAALAAWGKYVAALVNGAAPGNVVPMMRGAAGQANNRA